MSELILIKTDDPSATPIRKIILTDAPTLFGRAAECDETVADTEVSRQHFEAWLDEEGRVVVRDLGSKNGTIVDGAELPRHVAKQVQRSILLGGHELQLAVPAAGFRSDDESTTNFGPEREDAAADVTAFPSSYGLNLSQARLEQLMELLQTITGGAIERRQLLEQAMDVCMNEFGFERGLIALKTERGETESPVLRNVRPDQVSRTFVNRALFDGERTVVNDAANELADITQSVVAQEICSALCVPIQYRDEILGVIYGDRRTTHTRRYHRADVDFLAAVAQQVGVGVANLRMVEQHVRLKELERERRRARTLQLDLLPKRAFERGVLRIVGYNEASEDVSGDYYDYFPLDERRCAFVVADVSGHGLDAALLAANLQAAVHLILPDDRPLPELVAKINRLICKNTSTGRFITGIIGAIDTETGEVAYVCCGHPQPLHVGEDGVRQLTGEHSFMLGFEPEDTYELNKVTSHEAPGVFLLFTDGLFEAQSEAGHELGLEAIFDTLKQHPATDGSEVIGHVREVVSKHLGRNKNGDDLTLLTLEIRPS